MKKGLLLLLLFAFFSCKEAPKEVKPEEKGTSKETRFPEALQKVFKAHGGVENWKNKKSLVYEIPKTGNKELHTINLYSRKDRIDTSKYIMGSNGREVWLSDKNGNYKGDPVFYHNLMFYFYAMPFVLADTGITYERTEDLIYEGKQYPGIKISYDKGIGTSPKDEYFIHYEAETHQMAWLGYTVTYKSGEQSDKVNWIRYNDWIKINDVVLPNSITWHAYEGREIKEVRSTVFFENVELSEIAKPDLFFEKPI